MREKEAFKLNEMKIFKYKNIIVNLFIFVFATSILLGRNEIIQSQNRHTEIWYEYNFEQAQYRNVVTQTNIACFIALLLLVYAVISNFLMFRDKRIESKIVDFIISKIKQRENFVNKIKEKSKIIVIFLTILTIGTSIFAIINENSFIGEFRQEFEIYEESKTNALLLKLQGHHMQSAFSDPLLYIFILCYLGMFTMWKIVFEKEKIEEQTIEITRTMNNINQ